MQLQESQQCANGLMLVETWLGGFAENRGTRSLDLLRLDEASSKQQSIQ